MNSLTRIQEYSPPPTPTPSYSQSQHPLSGVREGARAPLFTPV